MQMKASKNSQNNDLHLGAASLSTQHASNEEARRTRYQNFRYICKISFSAEDSKLYELT